MHESLSKVRFSNGICYDHVHLVFSFVIDEEHMGLWAILTLWKENYRSCSCFKEKNLVVIFSFSFFFISIGFKDCSLSRDFFFSQVLHDCFIIVVLFHRFLQKWGFLDFFGLWDLCVFVCVFLSTMNMMWQDVSYYDYYLGA